MASTPSVPQQPQPQQLLLSLAWRSTVRQLDRLATLSSSSGSEADCALGVNSRSDSREKRRNAKRARKCRELAEAKVLHYGKRTSRVSFGDAVTNASAHLEPSARCEYWFPFAPEQFSSARLSREEQAAKAATPKKRKRVTFDSAKNSIVIIHKHPAVAASLVPPALFVREVRNALRLRLEDSENEYLSEEQSVELLTTRAIELARAIQNFRRKPLSTLHLERLYSLCRDQASTSIFIVTTFIDYGDVETVVDVLLDPYY